MPIEDEHRLYHGPSELAAFLLPENAAFVGDSDWRLMDPAENINLCIHRVG